MATPFKLEIITPTETAFSADVIHFRAPGVDGDFGVLANHAPMMAALKAGRLHVDDSDEGFDFVISGGFLEVHDSKCVVFAETCIRKDDIDITRAQAARDRALKELEAAATEADKAVARAALSRALARIKVAES